MTTAQRKGIEIAFILVSGAVTVAFSAGYARREVDTKEDREAHAADVRSLSDRIRDERELRQLQVLRDSATMATLIVRVTEVACDQNPRRRYCR